MIANSTPMAGGAPLERWLDRAIARAGTPRQAALVIATASTRMDTGGSFGSLGKSPNRPQTLDATPWPGGINEFRDTAVKVHDANNDGFVCLKTMWTDRNENSNWFGVMQFLLRDNNANGSA